MGRTTEREELERLLESANGGHGGRLLLLGDAGMGTSHLLAWVVERAHAQGVPTAALPATDLPPDADDLEACLTGSEATLVAVDDAHRGCAATMLSLDTAAARPGVRDRTIVVAARTGSPAARALADWPVLMIGPLSTDESARLLELTLDRAHSPAVLYRLADAVGGSPLALRHVPDLLTAEQLTGHRPLPTYLPMPAPIDQTWGCILEALPASARRAAVDLVVSGPRLDLLAAMRIDADWSDDDLAALADAGLVQQPTGRAPDVTHPVVRHVIAARTPTTALRARHRRAADLGPGLGLPPREVADHLINSVATADDAVAAALEAQARRAESLDQLVVASDAWQAAARLSTTGLQRVERGLRGLRLVIENGLDYAGSEPLLDLLADEQLEGECALWVEWLRTLQRSENDPATALTAQWSTIRRARVAAPDTLRALLWDAAMNAWSLGDPDAGLRAAREYAEVERAVPAPGAVEPPWTGIALVAAGLFQAGLVAESVPHRRRAISDAAGVDPTDLGFDRLLSMVFLDDLLLDASPGAGDRALVAAQRAQDRSAPLACLDGIRAWRARACGDWASAHRLLARGRPLAALTGATGAQLGMAALTCELAALEGDDGTLHDEAPRLRADADRVGDRRRMATLDRAVGVRALVEGRLDEAYVSLSAAARVGFLGRGLRDAVLPSRVDLIEVMIRQGDRARASEDAEDVIAVLQAMDDPLARALALRVRALVDDDVELLRTALEAHAESHDAFEYARTRLLLAERLRRDRQRATARTHLLEAERIFAGLGAAPWLARTRAELRAAGGTAEPAADLTSLTPQEAAVAHQVASGLSNREIAQALFLSPRTVEYHLGSVYRKLGIRGRAALTRLMVDA